MTTGNDSNDPTRGSLGVPGGHTLIEGLTFDDVLLVPRRSEVLPSQVDVRTRFSRNVPLQIPSSPRRRWTR